MPMYWWIFGLSLLIVLLITLTDGAEPAGDDGKSGRFAQGGVGY